MQSITSSTPSEPHSLLPKNQYPAISSHLHYVSKPSQAPEVLRPPAPDFLDPAIVSFDKNIPSETLPDYKNKINPSIPLPGQTNASTDDIGGKQATFKVPFPGNGNEFLTAKSGNVATAPVSATLTKPFSALNIPNDASKNIGTAPSKQVNDPTIKAEPLEVKQFELDGQTKKKTRRKRRPRRPQTSSSPELAKAVPPLAISSSKGWRETPLLEHHANGTFEKNHLNRFNRKDVKHQQRSHRAASGWATEDATEIQELGDFDFEGNLSKFDKKSVFDQIRHRDTNAAENLLVAQNQVKRPGTFDGTKLHPRENVLTQVTQTPLHISLDSDSGDAELSEVKAMPRVNSRLSKRHQPVRKNSARTTETSFTTSTDPFDLAKITNVNSIGSPVTHDLVKPSSLPQATVKGKRSKFRYVQNGQTCPAVTPAILREIESVAFEQYSLDSDMLADRAGRSIAEVVVSTINPGGRRLNRENHNASPVVVLLLGDSRASASILAAACHLLDRDIRVVASAVDGAAVQDSEAFTLQAKRFDNEILRWEATSRFLKTLDAPPELIVDGLVGIYNSCRLLVDGQSIDTQSQRDAMEMMAWANKSRAAVLAIDLPSGIDPLTGFVRIKEGEPVEIRAKSVVCCGIPCSGLLRATESRSREGHEEDWRIQVCDVGINRALGKVSGMRHPRGCRRNVNFGVGWIATITVDADVA